MHAGRLLMLAALVQYAVAGTQYCGWDYIQVGCRHHQHLSPLATFCCITSQFSTHPLPDMQLLPCSTVALKRAATHLTVGQISGTTADYFLDNTDWAGNQVQIEYNWDAGNARSGNRALCIKVIKGFSQTVQWVEKLPTGRTYSLSLWAQGCFSQWRSACAVGVEKDVSRL